MSRASQNLSAMLRGEVMIAEGRRYRYITAAERATLAYGQLVVSVFREYRMIDKTTRWGYRMWEYHPSHFLANQIAIDLGPA